MHVHPKKSRCEILRNGFSTFCGLIERVRQNHIILSALSLLSSGNRIMFPANACTPPPTNYSFAPHLPKIPKPAH